MALAPDLATRTDPNTIEDDGTHTDAPGLNYFVMGLFFIFGGITSRNDVIIPKLKELFTLSYMRGAVAGLVTMILGCLLFIPASQTATYPIFLGAFFILASCVVIVQVVASPLISLLGPAKTAHSRLTFAQAFNSLGTTIFPIVGATVILGSLAAVSADQLSGA